MQPDDYDLLETKEFHSSVVEERKAPVERRGATVEDHFDSKQKRHEAV